MEETISTLRSAIADKTAQHEEALNKLEALHRLHIGPQTNGTTTMNGHSRTEKLRYLTERISQIDRPLDDSVSERTKRVLETMQRERVKSSGVSRQKSFVEEDRSKVPENKTVIQKYLKQPEQEKRDPASSSSSSRECGSSSDGRAPATRRNSSGRVLQRRKSKLFIIKSNLQPIIDRSMSGSNTLSFASPGDATGKVDPLTVPVAVPLCRQKSERHGCVSPTSPKSPRSRNSGEISPVRTKRNGGVSPPTRQSGEVSPTRRSPNGASSPTRRSSPGGGVSPTSLTSEGISPTTSLTSGGISPARSPGPPRRRGSLAGLMTPGRRESITKSKDHDSNSRRGSGHIDNLISRCDEPYDSDIRKSFDSSVSANSRNQGGRRLSIDNSAALITASVKSKRYTMPDRNSVFGSSVVVGGYGDSCTSQSGSDEDDGDDSSTTTGSSL
eukprot:sb/3464745/